MRLAILYTSYRQFRELDFLPEIFRRSPKLSSDATIIFHCNNSKISQVEMAKKLARIKYLALEFVYSPQKNVGGYPYGQFEAICDVWDKLIGRFDWVIHLHPDVFIMDENLLLQEIVKAQAANADLLVTPTFGSKHPSFATDFFAFRPSKIPKELFNSFEPLIRAPAVVPLEHLFFNEVHRHQINYTIVQRFRDDHYHRDIDLLGLWHEHDLRRVKIYFKEPRLRWIYTALNPFRKPYRTMRLLLRQSARRMAGSPCESLAKQLTSF